MPTTDNDAEDVCGPHTPYIATSHCHPGQHIILTTRAGTKPSPHHPSARVFPYLRDDRDHAYPAAVSCLRVVSRAKCVERCVVIRTFPREEAGAHWAWRWIHRGWRAVLAYLRASSLVDFAPRRLDTIYIIVYAPGLSLFAVSQRWLVVRLVGNACLNPDLTVSKHPAPATSRGTGF